MTYEHIEVRPSGGEGSDGRTSRRRFHADGVAIGQENGRMYLDFVKAGQTVWRHWFETAVAFDREETYRFSSPNVQITIVVEESIV